MPDRQLNLAGGEEDPLERTVRGQLSDTQREILQAIHVHGEITTVDAGRIVHARRSPPCARCREGRCAFVELDGSDALKRLKRRGHVRRLYGDVWIGRR
jgi:hypothetical protein